MGTLTSKIRLSIVVLAVASGTFIPEKSQAAAIRVPTLPHYTESPEPAIPTITFPFNPCYYLESCKDIPGGFEFPDGISQMVCTNGTCIDTSATYSQGYADGYAASAPATAEGFTAGSAAGVKAGYQPGFLKGESDGQYSGYQNGYISTYQNAYDYWWPIGYADGQEDAILSCYTGDDTRVPSSRNKLGYTGAALNATLSSSVQAEVIRRIGPEPIRPRFGTTLCSYISNCTVTATGYNILDGEGGVVTCTNGVCKDNNPNYNSGYTAGFAAGTAANYAAGYAAGYTAGYKIGYNTGYTAGYNTTYGPAYSQGQTDGANQGAYDGYNDGYDAGYASITCYD